MLKVDVSTTKSGPMLVTISHQAVGFAPYRLDNCTSETLHIRWGELHPVESHSIPEDSCWGIHRSQTHVWGCGSMLGSACQCRHSDGDVAHCPPVSGNAMSLNQDVPCSQHQCSEQEDVLRPYTSLDYAWDEPALPHRLNLALPGNRKLGSFWLDKVSTIKFTFGVVIL